MSECRAIQNIMDDMYIHIKGKTEQSVTEDDITVRVTVGEVENGFIVTKNVSGRRLSTNKDNTSEDGKEWFDEGKTYITTKNPLAEGENEEVKLPDVKGLMALHNSDKIAVS